jgi:hypothetical protein
MKSDNLQLALDAIMQKPVKGIPSWAILPMEHSIIERLAGVAPGDYAAKPVETYLAMQKNAETCMIDQWIPENPLTIESYGYEHETGSATTGARQIIQDGILIDSPEAALQHIETVIFQKLQKSIDEFDEDMRMKEFIKNTIFSTK